VFVAAAILIVAGVVIFVAAPLSGGLIAPRRRSAREIEAMRLEHERGLAVQGLRELEFDRTMGKLGDADFNQLRAALEARAIAAMTALEKLRAAVKREPILLVDSISPVSPAPEWPAPAQGAGVKFPDFSFDAPNDKGTAPLTSPLRVVPSVRPATAPKAAAPPAPVLPFPAATTPLAAPSTARPDSARPASAASGSRIRFCPQCGTRTAPRGRFCAACGSALNPAVRASGSQRAGSTD
jgi:hypothetical protein